MFHKCIILPSPQEDSNFNSTFCRNDRKRIIKFYSTVLDANVFFILNLDIQTFYDYGKCLVYFLV